VSGRDRASGPKPHSTAQTRRGSTARRSPRRGMVAPLALGLCLARTATFALGADVSGTEPTEFFERHIRPILVEHCYSCHSDQSERVRGGLRLDTRAALLRGGNAGPAIVPGDPDASLLIKAVRYTQEDLQMPPKNQRLAGEQVAHLEAWVQMGAPDPRDAARAPAPSEIAEARARHWAFQPVQAPALPEVRNRAWVQTPVDAFVLARLERQGLEPADPADRRMLIRRVTYDLLGLPPTPEEVEAYVQSEQPDAYARLVDRLLASPHYGERWGRHWLDVARYADTKGYLAGGEERRYAFSYTYRDYVIRAFNEDKPFDPLLLEQIAADRMPLGEDKTPLAALGFLTLGRRFLNNPHDIVDDRIDVVTRGTLGLTVACARCHDHKFDPISTQDYYALYGVFASSEEPAELPLLGPLQDTPAYRDYLAAKAKIEAEIETFQEQEIAKFIGELRQKVGDYLLGTRSSPGLEDPAKFDTYAVERKLIPAVLRRWLTDLAARRERPDPIFGPWFALSSLPEEGFATEANQIIARVAAPAEPHPQLAAEGTPSSPRSEGPEGRGTEAVAVNPAVAQALAGRTLRSLAEVAEVYNTLLAGVDAEWRESLAKAAKEQQPAPAALPDPDREALRRALYEDGAPVNLPKDDVRRIHARRLREGSAPIRNKIDALSWTHPGVPLRAMALVDRANPSNARVFLRGNPGNPGAEVPRRFLEVLSDGAPAPFTEGSGRLELAQAIASPHNPLTARVYVNRVWLQHFGEGLLNTPGDFGVRTAAPLHGDLLDYLAASFVQHGWSVKRLQRLILLSSTYRQSTDAKAASLEADPENRWLTRMNRRRLDFEAMRDTLLAVSGQLDLELGGLPVDIVSDPSAPRRTVYGLIDRQNLPGLFRTFDFANPDTSNQRRFRTTVPQQALFMLNSPFAIEQARALARGEDVTRAGTAAEQVQVLYRRVLQRAAQHEELFFAEAFLAAPLGDGSSLSPIEQYAQVLLCANELTFVD